MARQNVEEICEQIKSLVKIEYETCLRATYNELVDIVNSAYQSGKTKVSGSIIVGSNMFGSTHDVEFGFRTEEILDLAYQIGFSGVNLAKSIKIVDLWANDYNPNYIGIKFYKRFFDVFKVQTETAKDFINTLNDNLTALNMQVVGKRYGEFTEMKIKYNCIIPENYQPKQHI